MGAQVSIRTASLRGTRSVCECGPSHLPAPNGGVSQELCASEGVVQGGDRPARGGSLTQWLWYWCWGFCKHTYL